MLRSANAHLAANKLEMLLDYLHRTPAGSSSAELVRAINEGLSMVVIEHNVEEGQFCGAMEQCQELAFGRQTNLEFRVNRQTTPYRPVRMHLDRQNRSFLIPDENDIDITTVGDTNVVGLDLAITRIYKYRNIEALLIKLRDRISFFRELASGSSAEPIVNPDILEKTRFALKLIDLLYKAISAEWPFLSSCSAEDSDRFTYMVGSDSFKWEFLQTDSPLLPARASDRHLSRKNFPALAKKLLLERALPKCPYLSGRKPTVQKLKKLRGGMGNGKPG